MPSSALPHVYPQLQLGIKGRSGFWEGYERLGGAQEDQGPRSREVNEGWEVR